MPFRFYTWRQGVGSAAKSGARAVMSIVTEDLSEHANNDLRTGAENDPSGDGDIGRTIMASSSRGLDQGAQVKFVTVAGGKGGGGGTGGVGRVDSRLRERYRRFAVGQSLYIALRLLPLGG